MKWKLIVTNVLLLIFLFARLAVYIALNFIHPDPLQPR